MSQHDERRDELEDRLTDQALAEVVGGRRPPDLTARILAAAQPVSLRRSRKRQFALAASVLMAVGLAAAYAVFHSHGASSEPQTVEKSIQGRSKQEIAQESAENKRNAVAKQSASEG